MFDFDEILDKAPGNRLLNSLLLLLYEMRNKPVTNAKTVFVAVDLSFAVAFEKREGKTTPFAPSVSRGFFGVKDGGASEVLSEMEKYKQEMERDIANMESIRWQAADAKKGRYGARVGTRDEPVIRFLGKDWCCDKVVDFSTFNDENRDLVFRKCLTALFYRESNKSRHKQDGTMNKTNPGGFYFYVDVMRERFNEEITPGLGATYFAWTKYLLNTTCGFVVPKDWECNSRTKMVILNDKSFEREEIHDILIKNNITKYDDDFDNFIYSHARKKYEQKLKEKEKDNEDIFR